MALNIAGSDCNLTYVKMYFQSIFRVNITFCSWSFWWHYAKCLVLSFYEDILIVLLCTKYKQKILNCAFMNANIGLLQLRLSIHKSYFTQPLHPVRCLWCFSIETQILYATFKAAYYYVEILKAPKIASMFT